MIRYCPRCKLTINFKKNDVECPICTELTILESDEARVQRVRRFFEKLSYFNTPPNY